MCVICRNYNMYVRMHTRTYAHTYVCTHVRMHTCTVVYLFSRPRGLILNKVHSRLYTHAYKYSPTTYHFLPSKK